MASARLAGGSGWPEVVRSPLTSTIDSAIDVASQASLCTLLCEEVVHSSLAIEALESTRMAVVGGAKEKLHFRLSRWQGYWHGEQSCAHAMCRLVWA